MRLRLPRFALVLTLLVAPVSVAGELLEGGGAHSRLATMLGSGPAHACVRAQAIAHAGLRGVLTSAGRKVVLDVHRDAVASQRACADGDSGEGARSAALNRAYSGALATARQRAQDAARAALAQARARVAHVPPAALSGTRAPSTGDQAAALPAPSAASADM